MSSTSLKNGAALIALLQLQRDAAAPADRAPLQAAIDMLGRDGADGACALLAGAAACVAVSEGFAQTFSLLVVLALSDLERSGLAGRQQQVSATTSVPTGTIIH